MSSEVTGQLVVFTCDLCGESHESAGTWKDVWAVLKEDGWRCFKDEDGDWVHRCPQCRARGAKRG